MSLACSGDKNVNFGKKLSLETRLKMAASRTGQKRSAESCAKMSEAAKRREARKKVKK